MGDLERTEAKHPPARAARRGGGLRRLILACTTALACAALATAAGAQDQLEGLPESRDPATAVGDEAGVYPDTDATPHAKETDLWEQIAGARYPERSVPSGSLTPFHVNFHTVSFRNQRRGFAAGDACKDPSALPPSGDPGFAAAVKSCERVPVVYRYFDPQNAPATWTPQPLGGALPSYLADGEGYVGAIAWIDSQTALAVGGDGRYPRRELEREPGETYQQWVARDEAGMARAWLYSDDAWSELDLASLRAPSVDPQGAPRAGMRGLTALDTHRVQNYGWAGGLGQLWEWKDGRFSDERFDAQSASPGSRAPLFEYRVRQVRAIPHRLNVANRQFIAATAGCCASSAVEETPRLLFFGSSSNLPYRWFVRNLDHDPLDYDLNFGTSTDPTDGRDPVSGGPAAHRRASLTFYLPDSFYAVNVKGEDSSLAVAAVASPGGPEGRAEPAEERSSIATGSTGTGIDIEGRTRGNSAVPFPQLLGGGRVAPHDDGGTGFTASSWRLVAADGDSEPPPGGADTIYGNGVPDWAVGELRSTDQGLGGRAIAVSTLGRMRKAEPEQSLRPDCGTFRDRGTGQIALGNFNNCRLAQLQSLTVPTPDAETLTASLESRAWRLSSYRLNALDMIGLTGDGWAVGDYGALVRIGTGATVASAGEREPDPPALGARRTAALAEDSAYAGFQPAASSRAIGDVPTLDERPRERLAEPRLVPYGSPDSTTEVRMRPVEDVSKLVMSRDGSEGWAFGPSEEAGDQNMIMTLYHYDGSRWTRCDTEGIPGLVELDEACAGLQALKRRQSGGTNYIKLRDAARVPLENDADPTNDGEFEVVALTESDFASGQGTFRSFEIIRYRDGRWRFEDEAALAGHDFTQGGANVAEPDRIAFAAPDDGWLISGNNLGALWHFDGARWLPCQNAAAGQPLVATNERSCGNLGGRIRSAGSKLKIGGLTVAGRRVYLFGMRTPANSAVPRPEGVSIGVATDSEIGEATPVILHREPGEEWTAEDGGFDPAFGKDHADLAELARKRVFVTGTLDSISVAQRPDGRYEGWAVGSFGGVGRGEIATAINYGRIPEATLMHLAPGAASWELWRKRDAAFDYLREKSVNGGAVTPPRQLSHPGEGERLGEALIAQLNRGRILRFDPARERWEPLVTDRSVDFGIDPTIRVQAFAPDGEGGSWVGTGSGGPSDLGLAGTSDAFFYRLTRDPPRETFEEVPHPITGQRVTALAGAPAGTVWAAATSGLLYRYDRIGGWQRIGVPGWDPGRVVTVTSEVNAIALGPDGEGVAVGKAGRIAQLSDRGVRLDAASGGVPCDLAKVGTPELRTPCGTGRSLRAAAVAPGGSALVGGDGLSLLWRPAGGEFRAIEKPPANLGATIRGVAMPLADRAWIATDSGQVFAGELTGERWKWRAENETPLGDLTTIDSSRQIIPLRDIEVDAEGHGYAVGDRGVVLERDRAGGLHPWRRLKTSFTTDLKVVALPQGVGSRALFGGDRGAIYTVSGERFGIARGEDPVREVSGEVVGLALLPGLEPNQAEAWAAVAPRLIKEADTRDTVSQLFHYASDPAEPLLNAAERTRALADAPARSPGELELAAFGNTGCHQLCTIENETGTNLLHERVSLAVARAIARRAPDLALLTGDAVDTGGAPGGAAGAGATEIASITGGQPSDNQFGSLSGVATATIKFRRFAELIADRLDAAGVPMLGAVGRRDLSKVTESAVTGRNLAEADNFSWRRGFGNRLEPWGTGERFATDSLLLKPVSRSSLEVEVEDVEIADPDGSGDLRGPSRTDLGSARTHYAVDLIDVSGEERPALARVVVLDTSLRSLAAADPLQNPIEPQGGQLGWLERVSCPAGSRASTGERCTRKPGQALIVLSNTPTYSYGGPGSGEQTQADGAALEALLLRNDTDLVVSGRLGWNGLYWATAPGLHEPCPGEGYRTAPPPPGAARACGRSATTTLQAGSAPDPLELAAALSSGPGGTGAIPVGRPLPFLVAASAGGPLDDESGQATDGFWRGYTIARLKPDAPGGLVVEQRPTFDWVQITAQERVLRPGQKMTLRGVGREMLSANFGARYDVLDSEAVTHSYDLVEADPAKPWVPRRDADGGYVPLDPSIATVDSQSGLIKVGKGNHPRAYAIGMLSVGCVPKDTGQGTCDPAGPDVHVATFPLVFEPRRTFQPAVVTQPRVAQIKARAQATLPQPPNPPSPPAVKGVDLPSPPGVPVPPPVNVPSVNPPSPPVPPPPPLQQSPVPLDLSASAPGVAIAPQTTVIPPPAPPIQPAPPGGARREARQRQSATQSSGSGSGSEGMSEAGDQGGDRADGLPGAHGSAMTRADRARADGGSMTAYYGAGVTLLAIVAAFGWNYGRPGPRRRSPYEAAPARAWARRR